MRTYTIIEHENRELSLRHEDGTIGKMTDLLEKDKSVYAFHGQMGAGKTTCITQLCTELGTYDVVNSPTFAIVNVYETEQHHDIYHFDCYRLKDIREALDFGAEDYLYSGNYCFIEWPDIIAPLLPEDTVHIYFEVLDDNTRKVTI